MTLNWTTVWQVVVWVLTALAMAVQCGKGPAVLQPAAPVLGAAASVWLHRYAGQRNPDGTPASVAFVPTIEAALAAKVTR